MSIDLLKFSILFLFGAAILIWAADRFVLGASAIAQHTGMSHFLIGLTIVAIGTSIPELFISILAALDHTPAIAIGDAIGSNVANIGLVTGCIILMKPEVLHQKLPPKMLWTFLIGTILACATLIDSHISILDGWLLLALFIALIFVKIWLQKKKAADPIDDETQQIADALSLKWASFWIIIGLILLPLSAKLTIMGAVGIAKIFSISEFVIGVFLVAVGTSLPELATTLISIYRNQKGIAMGNIIGSNLFNLTLVLAPIGIMSPATLPSHFIRWDLPFLLALTAYYIYATAFDHKRYLRFKGLVFLIAYIIYLVISVIFFGQSH